MRRIRQRTAAALIMNLYTIKLRFSDRSKYQAITQANSGVEARDKGLIEAEKAGCTGDLIGCSWQLTTIKEQSK